ncbi:MAG TPA: MASE4 domain-containing protein [Burkholderiales bacterium]|jgi:signal transduction histidine kinase
MFLSTLPATDAGRRLALAVTLASAAIFLAAAPFARLPLPQIPAFLPLYQSALVINDLITAVLLYGQFGIVRSRALLALASGYLFSAAMAIFHALSFPGLFAPTGLLGAGPQTTAWIYFFWHGGFPLFVIAYALLRDPSLETGPAPGRARGSILLGIALAFAAAAGLTLFTTLGHGVLPEIMRGDADASTKVFVAAGTWMIIVSALAALWRQRPHSVLDIWAMVVMCVWMFDVALAAVLNHGRYDLGWYAGRVYGLLAASFVLMVLLLENGRLYARIVEAHGRHARRLKMLHEIDLAVAGEQSTEAIAGAAIQALRELLGVPRAIINIFDLAAGEVEWVAAAGRRRVHVGPGVRYSMRLMGDVEALKRGEPQVIDTHALPPGPEMEALLASGVHAYMVMPMIAGGELIGAVSFGGERQPFHAEQVGIAREVATQLAIAVCQARLYERVKRQAEELEVRVRERTAELQAANKELDSFAYSVSHDLRAPLRALDGYAQILEEDHAARLDAEARSLLGVVRASSRKMTQLIEALLNFSRLGRIPLKTQPVPLDELIREVVGELHSANSGRRIEFTLGELGIAEGDPVLLKQVLANLVGNAVKYSRGKDPARVEIGRSAEPGKGAFWYVKDNGAGFDMSYYGKLFGVFQRLHGADEFEGTGVGLAIVQRVIARHGGLVWAESKPGQGATFCFTLGAGRSSAASA